MSQKELAQHYVLEIVARCRTVQSRCARLLEEEYFSEAPPAFARTSRRICEYLAKATVAIYGDIDWTAPADEIELDLTILRTTDSDVQAIAAQLRYVEGARTERLPWSLVSSFENMVAAFRPQLRIMLRAMWRYNYSFHMSDYGEVYRRALRQYEPYVPGMNLETEVLQEFQHPFHIISFPSLEQKHILLHCLLGHEIGHLLVDNFLTKPREASFLQKIRAEVETAADQYLQPLLVGISDDDARVIRERTIGEYLQEALTHWRRALEELLSDAAAIFLFGPAALMSTLDLAIQDSLDLPPDLRSQSYPPWRMRLRHALGLLDAHGGWFPIQDSLFGGVPGRALRVNNRVEYIRTLVQSTVDRAAIDAVPLLALAYREVDVSIGEGHAFLLNESKLAEHRPNSASVYKQLPRLIERLDHFIPPNAVDEPLGTERIASFAEIVNAAWFHKASMSPFDPVTGNFDETAVDQRNLMNNLTLKAIEFAQLSAEYSQWTPRS